MKDKILCERCKRELDWEQTEIIKKMSREELIKMVLGLLEELK